MSPIKLEDIQEDDNRSTKLKMTLQDLINGIIDPVNAAQTIDKLIIDDCEESLHFYTSSNNSGSPSLGTGDGRVPEPGSWLQLLWDYLGIAATIIPHNHSGQDRLVALIQELQRLPLHKVPCFESGSITEKELYNLKPGNGYGYFQQSLWELDQGKSRTTSNSPWPTTLSSFHWPSDRRERRQYR